MDIKTTMEMCQNTDSLPVTLTMENVYMIMDKLNVANQSILECCPSDIVQLDSSYNVTRIGEGLCTLMGLNAEQVIGQNGLDIHHHLKKLLESENHTSITTTDGSTYKYNHIVHAGKDGDTGTLHVFTNITYIVDLYNENQRLKEEAKQLQLIDRDTSLLTHRALLLILESQVSQCRRYETPLSIIKLAFEADRDNPDFKHKILKISRLLKEQLRWSDLIARSGEGQFTIILPETEHKSAANLISKLRKMICQWDDNCHVNFGTANWAKGSNSTDLLKECDNNLVKNSGSQTIGQDVAQLYGHKK